MNEAIRNAIARIDVMDGDNSTSRGTGTLVGDGLVVTALHVVADRRSTPPVPYPGQIRLAFPDHTTTATIEAQRFDGATDWVLLRCATAPPGVTPVPMQRLARSGVPWETFGFPDANPRDGMVQSGSVEAYDGELEGVAALQLFSQQAAAGNGAPVKGLSGAPIIVADALVGVLRFALMQEGRTVAGTLYGCPAATIAERNPDLLALRAADTRPSKLTEMATEVRTLYRVVIGVVIVLALGGSAWFLARGRGSLLRPIRHGDPKTVAVLPFRNINSDSQSAGLGDGIQDALVTQLGRVRELVAIAPASLRGFEAEHTDLRKMASAIGAGSIVDGSVQRSGDRIRVTARLVDPASGATRWTSSYDTLFTDVFAVQTDAALQIVESLQTVLSARERAQLTARPTENAAAYQSYLQGIGLLRRAAGGLVWTRTALPQDRASTAQALAQLEQAVARDSMFGLAWAKLAEAHVAMYYAGFDTTEARAAQADRASARAVAVDAALAQAHFARGMFLYRVRRDLDGALAEFGRAQAGLANDADFMTVLGLLERRVQRWPQATTHLLRASDLDALSWDKAYVAAQTLQFQRRYDDARRFYERADAAGGEGRIGALGLAVVGVALAPTTEAARDAITAMLVKTDTGEVFASLVVPEYRPLLRLLSVPLQTALLRRRLTATVTDPVEYYLAEATLAGALGQSATRAAYADSARTLATTRLRSDSLLVSAHSALGLALAMLGRADEAVAAGRRAVSLVALGAGIQETEAARGRWIGSQTVANAYANWYLAEIYLTAGRTDDAAAHVAQQLTVPGPLSAGWILTDPLFAPLRTHPRLTAALSRR